MKYANKIGASFTVVLGDSELDTGKANLKNMATGQQTEVELPTGLLTAVYDQMIENAMGSLTDSLEKLEGFSLTK